MDAVNLLGVMAGGSTEMLGAVPMPPRMKAREIASEYFGHFTEDDWLETQGWRPPTLIPVWPDQPPETGKDG